MATYPPWHGGIVVNAPAASRQTKCCVSTWRRAPSPIHSEVTTFLNIRLSERWIGWGGYTFWPPRSPDLTPLDFSLWGFVKDKVYVPPVPITVINLKDRMLTVTAKPDQQLLQHVWHEIEYFLHVCRPTNGAHWTYIQHEKAVGVAVYNGVRLNMCDFALLTLILSDSSHHFYHPSCKIKNISFH
jgi:hypothetical protein